MIGTSKSSQRHGGRGSYNLTEGNVRRQILQLTGYMVVGVVASMTFNLVDTFFVAQLGTEELAAMSFTFPVVMILHAIVVGIGTGVTAVISRIIGGGDRSKVRQLATDSILLAIFLALVLTIVGLATLDTVFIALGAAPDVLPLIHDYMVIWYLSTAVLVVPMIGNAVMRAHGDTRFPALIMSIGSVINIILDPILIFGLLGAPRLELQGAAVATLIARLVTLVAALWVLNHRMACLDYSFPALVRLLESFRRLLHIGLPATGTQMITPVSIAIITAMIASYGSEAVAAYGAGARIEIFSLMFVMALNIAIMPFIGQNAGAGRFDRVREALRFGFEICMFGGLVVAILLAVFAPWIATKFSDDPTVIDLTTLYLWVVPVSFGAYGIIGVTSSTFNSLALPLKAMILGISKSLLFTVPLAYLFSLFFGVVGIFAGFSLSSVLIGLWAYLWVSKVVKDKERIAGDSTLQESERQ